MRALWRAHVCFLKVLNVFGGESLYITRSAFGSEDQVGFWLRRPLRGRLMAPKTRSDMVPKTSTRSAFGSEDQVGYGSEDLYAVGFWLRRPGRLVAPKTSCILLDAKGEEQRAQQGLSILLSCLVSCSCVCNHVRNGQPAHQVVA
ncbi:hypothetical protein THAOC_37040 [Thalassiosira oceanica]|uniref:Uncharacterized protein n=1 Tax=Thalassiosira oceanica TaxID=159749 RepID=K0R0T1_THAOC|nr:hypothetical protein THAOC_37040 [Thalassiosira oceanica]|eukprot:EJK44419.1 hypothetical protein THAOC_37040 [Thalassiosira oceanica]